MQKANIETLAFVGTADKSEILSFNADRHYLGMYVESGDVYLTIGNSPIEIKLATGTWWEPDVVFINPISIRGAGTSLLVLTSGEAVTAHYPITYDSHLITYNTFTLTY